MAVATYTEHRNKRERHEEQALVAWDEFIGKYAGPAMPLIRSDFRTEGS